MKLKINLSKRWLTLPVSVVSMLIFHANVYAQDSTAVTAKESTPTEEVTAPVKAKTKPVKHSFQSIWIIDNQTVMVPVKGTFEMDIMHRFGTIKKGYEDLGGFFAPSNIRLGVTYAPINKLNLGFGITKSTMLWDVNAKYSLMVQEKGKYPVSISYYGDMGYSSMRDPDKSIFKYSTQRLSFFNQIIIARKITDKLSIQVSPNVSHQNAVNGYYTKNDSTGKTIFRTMKYDHFAISFSGRYKLTNVTSFMINYDQPITKHATNNPDPNLAFGFEFNSSGHSFQLFMGNYSLLSPQRNNLYNTNSPFAYTQADGTKVKGGNFLIGFNITRLWSW
jgi:hypothetical protein